MVDSNGCLIIVSRSKGNNVETTIENGCFIIRAYTLMVLWKARIVKSLKITTFGHFSQVFNQLSVAESDQNRQKAYIHTKTLHLSL